MYHYTDHYTYEILSDLLTTSMMSSPGSMAVAKLIQPEAEISYFRNQKRDFITKSTHRNVFDALTVTNEFVWNDIVLD